MSVYKIALGFDNTAGLVTLDPQPASDGVLDGKISGALSGAVYGDGPHTKWRYPGELDELQYDAVITSSGLTVARYREVTVQTNLGRARATWGIYNSIIQLTTNPRYRTGFYRDVEFAVLLFEELT